jgi:hypothetical protein
MYHFGEWLLLVEVSVGSGHVANVICFILTHGDILNLPEEKELGSSVAIRQGRR